MATVSVIVPIYNVERWLERCIDSVLSQGFSDFELILVNDGSPDSSGDICKAAAARDDRIRYFEKENGGLSSARNYGLDRACGEYICFIDSDDYTSAEALSECVQRLDATGADILLCGYIKENGKSRSVITAAEGILRGREINSRIAELKDKVLIDPAWNKLYRRDFIEKNSLRFTEGETYEDTDFNLRALEFEPTVAVTDKSYYHYVLHMGSITRRYNPEKLPTLKKRARLLKSVTEGADAFCDYYYIKFVFSAVSDMFLSCKAGEILGVLKKEVRDEEFCAAAENARHDGKATAIITAVAKSRSAWLIYLFCFAVYIARYKLSTLFFKVRK